MDFKAEKPMTLLRRLSCWMGWHEWKDEKLSVKPQPGIMIHAPFVPFPLKLLPDGNFGATWQSCRHCPAVKP